VIINYLNVCGAIGQPDKTDPKLIIDPNAVLGRAITHKRLQPVSRRNPQIRQCRGSVEHRELAHGNPLNIHKTPDPLAIEKALGISAGKG